MVLLCLDQFVLSILIRRVSQEVDDQPFLIFSLSNLQTYKLDIIYSVKLILFAQKLMDPPITETHAIRIFVKIKKIKLLVRFPCRLTIQLKADNWEIQSRSSYELKNGECLVNESIQAQVDVMYETRSKRYVNQEMKIIVNMLSNNGVIPVGCTSFNPCNKEYEQQVQYFLPLQKCQDKSAKINFIQSYVLLSKNLSKPNYKYQFIEKQAKDKNNRILSNSYSSKMLVNTSLYSKSPPQQDLQNHHRINIVSPKHNLLNSNPKFSSLKTLPSNVMKYQETQYKQVDERKPILSKIQEYPSSQIRKQNINANGRLSQKQIMRQKETGIKKQNIDKKQQLQRTKQQSLAISIDLGLLQQRIKQMEKKQKQMTFQLKESKQECQRRKNKFIQIEILKNQSDVIVFNKQQQIKQLQQQLKKNNEKNQELNGQLKNQLKKFELKENSYQQQLKKINDKCSNYENQRQKLTLENYELLSKLENAERNKQTHVRQKDRNYGEEKNKFSKKIDQLMQELNILKEEKNDVQNKLNEANIRLQKSVQQNSSTTTQLSILQEELLSTKLLLKRQQDQHVNYQEQKYSYKIIQQERDNLRKKYNQLIIQLNDSKQKTQKQKINLSNSENKMIEIQNQLISRLKEKELLQNSVNNYKKQLQRKKVEQQRKNIESQVVNANYLNYNKKLNELKNKFEISKKQAEILKQHYSSQIQNISKEKQYAQNQIEDMKWALQRIKSQNEQLKDKLQDMKSDILTLNEEMFISQQKNKKTQETTEELKCQLALLTKINLEMEEKNKNLNSTLKISSESIYQLQSKRESYQKQITICQEKIKQTQKKLQQKRIIDDQNAKEFQKQIGRKCTQIQTLQIERKQLKDLTQTLKQKNILQENQLFQIKQQLENIKQDFIQKDKNIFSIRLEFKKTVQENDKISKLFQEMQTKLNEQIKNSIKVKKQFDEYKKCMFGAVEILAQQICKDESNSTNKKSFIIFPDDKMSLIMDESIKKKKGKLLQYQSKIAQLEGFIINLEEQLKKLKNLQLQKDKQFQKLINHSQQKHQKNKLQKQSDCQKLQNEVQYLEGQIIKLSNQKDKGINQVKKAEEQIQELKHQNLINLQDNQLLTNKIEVLELKIIDYQSKEAKSREITQSKILQLNNNSNAIIQQLKSDVQFLQKKYQTEVKINKEGRQLIKKLQYQINEHIYQKERIGAQTIELINKLKGTEQNLKQSDKKVRILQKLIKQLESQLQKIHEREFSEQNKNKQLKINIDKICKELNQSQIDRQKLKLHQSELTKQNKELLQSLKIKSQKMKQVGDKTSLEVKELKQQIIKLTSNLDFKDFQIKKHLKQIQILNNNLNQVRQESAKLKIDNAKKSNQIQMMSKQISQTLQNIQRKQQKITIIENQKQKLINEITFLEQKLNLSQQSVKKIEIIERQSLQLKSQLEAVKYQKQKLLNLMIKNSSSPRNNEIKFNNKQEPETQPKNNPLQRYLQSNKNKVSLLERVKSLTNLDRQLKNESYSNKVIKFANK